MRSTILIVDDDPDIRTGVAVRMRAAGYDAVTAPDAVAGVGLFQKFAPALVLLDINLPGGDGFLVMQRIRELGSNTPVIVLSARDPELAEERALAAGAAAFFQKPADNSELLELISRLAPRVNNDATTPKYRVLVVDDDPDIRSAMQVRLRGAGFSTAAASDGLTAITVWQRDHPDVILLDIGLPGGDGYSVMQRLNDLGSRTPIVILSARDPAAHADRAFRLGAFAYLQKPPDNGELFDTLYRAAREAAPDGIGLRIA
ncbi:MAG: response regulator [Armatimonadetes bacterium]|nr:response regulator [Armatimonadota bacterium]MDE2206342.1 response regulator [Armatimonadota bacterium]